VLVLAGLAVPVQAQHESMEFALPPHQMGETLLNMRQYQPAASIFLKLFETEAENPYVVRGLVKAYAGMRKLSEARTQLESYLEKHPDSSSALYGLGLALTIQQEVKEAELRLHQALEKDPKNSPAHNTLAVLLYDRKEYPAAVGHLRQAADLTPGDLLIYRNLWRTYREMNQTDVFLQEFEAAKKNGPREKALGYGRAYAGEIRQQAFTLYQKGDRPGTIEKMKAMLGVYQQIDHAPGLVSGLFSLGLLVEEENRPKEALEYYRKVLEISPNHIQAQERLQELQQSGKNQ